ncbi:MAG: hypothetical protein WBI40_11910 [Methylococcaceae bacterium]
MLITCFSVDGLGDVYPCYQQDFTPIGFDLSKDKPIGKNDYGNELALVFEEDNAPPVQHDVKPKEKISINKLRDNDFLAWIESEKPPLDKMTKLQIHTRLIERNDKLLLWRISRKTFETWWEQQPHFKAPRGRKPTTNR